MAESECSSVLEPIVCLQESIADGCPANISDTSSVPNTNPKTKKGKKVIRANGAFKQGIPIDGQARQVVLNIWKRLDMKYPHVALTKLDELTAEAAGISPTTVFRIRSQATSNDGVVMEPRKTRATPKRRMDKYDEFILGAIRQFIYESYHKRQLPTSATILSSLNQDETLPNFSRATLFRVLPNIGIQSIRRKQYVFLMDRDDIVAGRRRYLRAMRTCRKQGRKIYYIGECATKGWSDQSVDPKVDTPSSDQNPIIKMPLSKRDNFILGHVGCSTGFVDNCLRLLIAELDKAKGVHQSEMNSSDFTEWMGQVLPQLERNSAIVVDNAVHHCVVKDEAPDSTWDREDIEDWCLDHDAYFEEDYLKPELLQVVEAVRSENVCYEFDAMAKEYGMQVLRLPQFHAFLNPMELVWRQVKTHVCCYTATVTHTEGIEALLYDGVAAVTTEQWQNYISLIQKQEAQFWELDDAIDETVERILEICGNRSDQESVSESEYESDEDESMFE